MLFAANSVERRHGEPGAETGMPPAWRVENDNVLRQVEGLAPREAGRKLWDETADSIALHNLRENTLGDLELTLRAGSSAA